MSKTTPINKEHSQISFEEQASKDNVFFSESLNGVINEDLSNPLIESSDLNNDTLLVDNAKFSVFPLKVERIDKNIFIDFKIHNFNISDFINFDIAVINMAKKNIDCKLISYCCPNEKVDHGLIRILLLEGT